MITKHYCEMFHFLYPHRFEESCAHAECLHCHRPTREHVCGRPARFFYCLRWFCADHYDERIASEDAIREYRLDAAVHDKIDIQ